MAMSLSLSLMLGSGSVVSGGADTTPSAFTFTDVADAWPGDVYVSNTITIAGIDAAAAVTVTGGEYSKNGGAYTSSAGSAALNDTFAVRGTASGTASATVNVALTVGGVSDTFSITTEAAALATGGPGFPAEPARAPVTVT